MDLKISITPKVNAVFYHLNEFCEMKKFGLGPPDRTGFLNLNGRTIKLKTLSAIVNFISFLLIIDVNCYEIFS